jgi:DNA-binding response OmpR family regulator
MIIVPNFNRFYWLFSCHLKMNHFMRSITAPNIYILEDDSDIGYLLNLFLTDEGFNIEVYNSIYTLNEALKQRLPDLFLLDVMLPDGSGMDVCTAIKTKSESSKLPVLMMSANAKPELVKTCGPEAFIQKPFDLNNLLVTVKSYLPAA